VAFTLTYTYGYDDFAALIVAKRSLGLMGVLGPATPYVFVGFLYLAFLIGSLAFDGVPLADMLRGPAVVSILAGLLTVMVLTALINLFFTRLALRPVFKRFAAADKEIIITLDEDGIKWSGAGSMGGHPWGNVKWIVETKQRVFLFISKVEAIVLPRRAVSSDGEFEALTTFVREHTNG